MFVIPSIDILNSKCVQLVNGRADTAIIYGTPQQWLNKWVDKGADIIHLIDLDAALDIGSNKDVIFELLKTNNVEIQVGGGIRSIEYASKLIQKGAKRIIIGSKALDGKFLCKLNKAVSKKNIMVALDLKNGFIVKNGWKTNTGIKIEEIIENLNSKTGSILSTDVSSEGLLKGPNYNLLKIIRQENIPTYASGGFTTRQDLKLAEKLGFTGVVIGQALYKEKLNFKDLW